MCSAYLLIELNGLSHAQFHTLQLSNFLNLQHVGDFNYPRLADFGAAISGANKLQGQEVLEELDVSYLCLSLKKKIIILGCFTPLILNLYNFCRNPLLPKTQEK